jgi:NAD(P)-dependent dehydrogenase (short-subunit alcohol dehydrogenase family)
MIREADPATTSIPSLARGEPVPGVVVVTGASAGIGRATATAFARRGWAVALLARGDAGLAGARREVEAAGGCALVITLDVADPAAVNAAADRVAARFRRIDVWVNNAMATVFGPADQVPAAEWQRVTDVTYLGAVHGTLAALRHMRKRDRGAIVQVGSALAYRSIPLQAPYCAAKAAMRGFTDALRCELLHDGSGVRLSVVHLPGVNTPQFGWSRTHMAKRHRPVGAVYQPAVAAEAIVKAAIEAPRELWVGAPVVQAILGSMAAPAVLDRYLARAAYEAQLGPTPAGDGAGILEHPSSRDGGVDGPFGAEAAPRAMTASSGLIRTTIAFSALGAVAAAFVIGRDRAGRARRGTRWHTMADKERPC